MDVLQKTFKVNGTCFSIRPASNKDAKNLSEIRLQIDGETQNLNREKGEAYLDTSDFEQLIKTDSKEQKNLFLVATVNENIVGFSRCEGNQLKRFAHKVEFGLMQLE